MWMMFSPASVTRFFLSHVESLGVLSESLLVSQPGAQLAPMHLAQSCTWIKWGSWARYQRDVTTQLVVQVVASIELRPPTPNHSCLSHQHYNHQNPTTARLHLPAFEATPSPQTVP